MARDRWAAVLRNYRWTALIPTSNISVVAGATRVAGSGARDVECLLPLALSRPQEALAAARAVLAGHPDPYDASVAHQAAGIVLREFGDIDAGIGEMRAALTSARRAHSAEREADILASLGVALIYAGRTASGLAAFDQALQRCDGPQAGRVFVRRGIALWALGRYAEALDDARHALSALRRSGDSLWLARALHTRALVQLAVGSTRRADADFVAAGRLFEEAGQELESIYTVLNRATVAFSSGDLPAALSFLDETASRIRPLGVPVTAVSIDRCAVLLAAGLARDALGEAEASVAEVERLHGRSTKKAELLLMAANCALAAGQPQAALDWAKAAHRLSRSQQSAWWTAHAAGAVAQAGYAAGLVSARLLREADRAAAGLEMVGAPEAARAHLLAGRVALDLGRRDAADVHFLAAAKSRRRGTPLPRASAWLSEALRAEASGRTRQLFWACRQGLAVLDEHQFTLGASELRAQATAHGAELATLGQRHAALAHQPRQLLGWSERWRATALAVPPVRPVADMELNSDLAALRDVMKRLDKARSQDNPNASVRREQLRLEREQKLLERAVRGRALRARAGARSGRPAVSIRELLDALADGQLAEIVDVDGILHVLLCGAGKVRQFTAGRAADAARAAAFCRFALRRLARSRPGDDLASALAILTATGPKLEAALLGPAARHLGDRPVVVVPPGKLHTIPWGLVPALRDCVVTVAPSAASWMRAQSVPPPARRHVILARGPGLVTDGAEVPAVAQLYDDVTMLAGSHATAATVLRALDGAWLAHIAAHGVFRADSPLFSSLRMHDGPLTVYDFEQLHSAPYRMVLSSCDSAVGAPAGADELLGLVSSLLPLGTAGIIAAIVPLSDHAAVPVMVGLHLQLRAGKTLAESLSSVRHGLSGNPIQRATAESLVALGAA
jgi:tetratricopeptide (TPR) repeat protein